MGYLFLHIEHSLKEFLLSIPFMGYFRKATREADETANFQFPLWDTSILGDSSEFGSGGFQFPLWDTEIINTHLFPT